MDSLISLKKNFQLIEQIGSGVSSEVYKALMIEPSTGFSQIVAVKIFKSPKFRKKFHNELENLTKIHHKNIISVKDWGEFQDKSYLVTEYINGKNLSEFLRLPLKLDSKLKKYIANQIYAGLSELRSKGICHGDLKPSNIMISVSGEVKLIDISFDELGLVFATPEFTAPEILLGSRSNFKSDLYGFGVILNYLGVSGQKLLSIEPGDREFNPFSGFKDKEEKEKCSILVREQLNYEPQIEVSNDIDNTLELNVDSVAYTKVDLSNLGSNSRFKLFGFALVFFTIIGFYQTTSLPIIKRVKLRSSQSYELWDNHKWVSLPIDRDFLFNPEMKYKKLKLRNADREFHIVLSSDQDYSKNIIINTNYTK